ncbi:hypothetical protein NXF25_009880 [Crotalus adamanteus]|uniref:BPTI/Kunitz inhibitor domain-containing protein n=1 Tax=Crotalus adamanteus TaxID=8729 RepID=A0AAW1BST6_CROAD
MSSGGLLLLLGFLTLWAELTPVSGRYRPRFCYLPAKPGPCEAYMPRFYYNSTSNKCQRFIYGGCGGNANNFETRDQCHYTCVKRAPTPKFSCCWAVVLKNMVLLPAWSGSQKVPGKEDFQEEERLGQNPLSTLVQLILWADQNWSKFSSTQPGQLKGLFISSKWTNTLGKSHSQNVGRPRIRFRLSASLLLERRSAIMDLVLKRSWVGLLFFFSVGMVHSEIEETLVQNFMTDGSMMEEIVEKAMNTWDNTRTINGVGGMEIKEFHLPEICTELIPPNEIQTSIITTLIVAEESFVDEPMEITMESKMNIKIKMSKLLTEYIGTEEIKCEEPSSCEGNLPGRVDGVSWASWCLQSPIELPTEVWLDEKEGSLRGECGSQEIKTTRSNVQPPGADAPRLAPPNFTLHGKR